MNTNTPSAHIKVMPIITCIFIIIAILVGIHTYHSNTTNQAIANHEHIEAVQNQQETKNLSAKNAINNFDKTKPNIAQAKKFSTARVTKAVQIACTKFNNDGDVSKYRPTIDAYLGQSAGNKLINDTKPMDVEYQVKQSQKLLGLNIGYGTYNQTNSTMPMYVLVKYRTSPFMSGTHYEGSPKTYYAVLSYRLKLHNTYGYTFQLTNYLRSANNSDM